MATQLGPASLAALERIAARANDVLAAYQPGAQSAFSDVRANKAPAASTDPLSVVAPPNALFVTSDATGERTYTRDGRFQLRNGTLTAPNGDAVLGTPPGAAPAAAPQPLAADPRDVALGRTGSARIAADGTVSYDRTAIDPRTGDRRLERVAIGRVALARFPAASELANASGGRLVGPRGAKPYVGAATDGTFGPLVPHARDTGTVDLTTALVKLQDAYLAFDAIRAAQKAGNGTAKAAMDLVK
jgi:flagellar basal body rod protein FlgG